MNAIIEKIPKRRARLPNKEYHARAFECRMCDFVAMKKSDLRAHIRRHHEKHTIGSILRIQDIRDTVINV